MNVPSALCCVGELAVTRGIVCSKRGMRKCREPHSSIVSSFKQRQMLENECQEAQNHTAMMTSVPGFIGSVGRMEAKDSIRHNLTSVITCKSVHILLIGLDLTGISVF